MRYRRRTERPALEWARTRGRGSCGGGRRGGLVLEDDLDLDGVARVEVLAVVGDRLPVHDVLEAGLAQLERVRVAVHREEGVARAVAGGVRVRL